MSSIEKTLLTQQLENYQLQRHDFLNNFQVIRGYLQLSMPNKAIEYIDETLLELVPQQEIFKVGQKSMLAILLGWFFELRLHGIKMGIKFSPELKEEEFWLGIWKEEYAQQFYGYTKECSSIIPQEEDPENLLAEIGLQPVPDGFVCNFKLLKQGNLYIQKDFSTKNGQ